ncbi:MAG TPA: hypothetical protein VLN47_08395 [Clostridiaceae bacterium]|nr:hypothetical protein [Clostridiaceae bacterium]
MKKKLSIIALVIVLALGGLFVYNNYLSPKAVEGAKEVQIVIIAERAGINETKTYRTDSEFVYDLLKEKEEELGIELEKFEFGEMVTTMKGIKAEANEFYSIQVNGTDAMTGIKEIPLIDKDLYRFELKKWQ